MTTNTTMQETIRSLTNRLRALERRPVPKASTFAGAPTDLTLVSATDSTITISWTAPLGVTVGSYRIYRNGLLAGSSSVNSFTDSGLSAGATFTYAVTAVNDVGVEGALSNPLSVATTGTPIDSSPPTTPLGLAASTTIDSVTLTWSPSSDNVGVAGYTVYRNGAPFALTPALSYVDNSVIPETNYTYTVDAYDDAGNHSGQSTAVFVTIPAAPSTDTWYISPTGTSSNTGAIDSPWSLDYALVGCGGGSIAPGNTIYLLDGVYQLSAVQLVTCLAGSAGNPIVFKPYPGARPRFRNDATSLHHTLELRDVSFVDFYDIEFTAYNYTRSPELSAASAAYHIYENPAYSQSDIRFRECKFHDAPGSAVKMAITSVNIEYNGCVFYYNGSYSQEDHTLLAVANDGSSKVVRNCVFMHNAAGDLWAFSDGTDPVNDVQFLDNLIIKTGSLYTNPGKALRVGGTTITPDQVTVNRNATFDRATADTDSRSLQVGDGGTSTPGSYDVTVSNGDGRWTSDGSGYSANPGSLTLGFTSAGIYNNVFSRFAGVTIPQGATIVSAYARYDVQNTNGTSQYVHTKIHLNDVDDVTAYPANAAACIALARTTAEVTWDIGPGWAATPVNTADFSTVLQELVDRPGWASGNGLLLLLDENGGTSTNDIFLTSTAHATLPAPELHVTYTTGTADGGATNIVVQSNVFIGQPVDIAGSGYSGLSVISNEAIYSGSHTGTTQSDFPSNTWTGSYPTTGTRVICKALDYDTKRANLLILNWAGASSVSLTPSDLTGVLINSGDSYELHNIENYYSDVILGVFNGTSITVPMTGHSSATPAGGLSAPATVFPNVGVFQLIVGGASAPGGDTTPPTVPASLSATGATSPTRVILTWDPSTDASGVVNYKLYRDGIFLADVPHVQGTVSGGTNGDPAPGGSDYYVSTSGSSSNPGSSASPWSLSYLLSGSSPAGADDTVWIRSGTYTGNWNVSMKGTSGHPLRVMAYPGERVHMKSGTSEGSTWTLYDCQYLELWNIEFDWPTYSRSTRDDAYQPNGACIQDQTTIAKLGVKFYGCFFRNAYGQGFRARETGGHTWEGCHFYYNGAGNFDHGLYTWNTTRQKIVRNCLFHHMSGHCIHGYNTSSTKSEDNYLIEDNLMWMGASLYPSGTGRAVLLGDDAQDTNDNIVRRNLVYDTQLLGSKIKIGYPTNGWYNNDFTDNFIIGVQIDLASTPRSGNVVTGNKFYDCQAYGDSRSAFPSNVWAAKPTSGSDIFVKAYTYNAQKANIAVYNWSGASAVSVSNAQLVGGGLDIANGDTYKLHSGENYFGDIITGTYDGTSISLPMTGHTMETPVGVSAPTSRSGFPNFGPFVIEVIKSGTSGPATQTYTDSAVSAGNTYTYTVAAEDSFGNISALSTPDSVTI